MQSLDNRVTALEGGSADTDTIYDDTSLSQRVSALESLASVDVSFTVNDGTDPIQGAVVTVATGKTGTTGSSGGCTISSVFPNTYTVTVVAEGYENYSDEKAIDDDHKSFTISLTESSG